MARSPRETVHARRPDAPECRHRHLITAVAGLLVLAGCSTNLVSAIPEETSTSVVDESTSSTASASATPSATDSSTPSTTVAETTTTSTTTTTTTTTTTSTTTTTLPDTAVPVAVLTPPLEAIGTRSGPEAARLQQRLLDLGFWLSGVDGEYGLTTRQAVMAAQKYIGLPANGSLDAATARYLSELDQKPRGRADAGTVLEVDKTRQLLFFVVDGVTQWVVNTSTGSEVRYEKPNKKDPTKIERGDSVTPNGLHRVNRQRAEGWWEGDLGEIYRPKYFIGGVAVHGSSSIPNYPASHGCVRVSVPAMDWIWESELLPMNSPVWVHGSNPSR